MRLLFLLILSSVIIGIVLTYISAVLGEHYKEGKKKTSSGDYGEALITYRHYSNLRFLMLPFFATVMGVLLSTFFSQEQESSKLLVRYIPTVGLWLSLAFLALEIALDLIMTKTALYITNAKKHTHMRRDILTSFIQGSTRFPILILFAVSIWIWLKISGHYSKGVLNVFFPY